MKKKSWDIMTKSKWEYLKLIAGLAGTLRYNYLLRYGKKELSLFMDGMN